MMAKYVDLVWLSSAIHNLCKENPITEDEIHSIIAEAPTKEIGTCKDCKHCREDFSFTDKPKCLSHGLITVNDDFYCADFEKRGNENG